MSSLEHRGGSIHFGDLTGERAYSPGSSTSSRSSPTCSSRSSSTGACARRGSPCARFWPIPAGRPRTCRHPGRLGPGNSSCASATCCWPRAREVGALPQLYAAVDPGAESGHFYGPGGPGELRGHPKEVRPGRRRKGRGDGAAAVGALREAHRGHLELLRGAGAAAFRACSAVHGRHVAVAVARRDAGRERLVEAGELVRG